MLKRNKEKSSRRKKERSTKSKADKKKVLLWRAGIVCAIVFGILAALTFWSRLYLKIYIEKEIVSFEEKIEVKVDSLAPDFDLKIIPGKVYSKTKEKWQVFETSGKTTEESKARGEIIVYNNADYPVSLIPGTRFLSSEGEKTFKTESRITVPQAKTDSSGKTTPGSLKVEVVAQEAGEDYNIGPADFSIPALVNAI